MSDRTVEQRAAREVQKILDCPYSSALRVARSQEAREAAESDATERPFRKKLADVVVGLMKEKEFSKVWEPGGEKK